MADNTGVDNALLAAIGIAAQDAAARVQAALGAAQIQATAEVAVANIRATADQEIADDDAAAREQVAATEAQSRVSVASIDSGWHATVANIEAAAQESVATTAADADKAVATTHAQAVVTSASTAANAQVEAANIQGTATVSAATIDAAWHQGVATTTANATISVATIDASWHQGVANTELIGTEYKADKDLAGVNVHEAAETGRLNLKLAFANDKWNTLLPIIDDALGLAAQGIETVTHTGGGAGFHASARPGPIMGFGSVIASSDDVVGSYSRRTLGRSEITMGGGDVKSGGIGFGSGGSLPDAVAATQLPFIATSGVLTPSQIQQQVNAAYARNDAKANSESLRLVEEMSGRGFSANSPILGALRVGLTGQNLRSSILAEQAIRLEAAKANAEATFDAQKAVSDQFIAQEGVLVDSAKNDVTRVVGILSAISQLIGSAL